jgi:hypothetical protein
MNGEMQAEGGMVGLFWVVEEDGKSAIIALTVPLSQAVAYSAMLTVNTGHLEHWSFLARRGARALRAGGNPTAPVWSEYEEWPRGRVLYDCVARRFVVRADRQLHRPEFMQLIADRFCIPVAEADVFTDDHYRSIRTIPVPRT